MLKSPRLFAATATAVLLGACAQQPTTPEKTIAEVMADRGYAIGEPVQEIRNYQINGWNSVDDKHLIVNSGPSKDYLISLKVYCVGLTSTEDVQFTTTAGTLTRLDKVVVNEMAVPSHCPIDKIETLTRVKKGS